MKAFIKNILILDPFRGKNYYSDVWIENSKIKALNSHIHTPEDVDLYIDGQGKVMFPGLIDLHTHLREPGFEYKEDIASGTRAALHGGFTTITAFPNTNPVLDNVERIKMLKASIQHKAAVNVLPVASITIGQKGKELVDFSALSKEGVAIFTDDGKGVQDQAVLISAMRKIKELNALLLLHTEDESLVNGGVIHAGKKSEALGLKGIVPEAEEVMLLRDIALAKMTGAKTHFCHVSTEFGAKMIAAAKQYGIKISAETAPHYLCFSEDLIKNSGESNKKMNPPLRTEKDRKGLVQALKSGMIDVIATDHAPHSEEEKSKSITESPFGIIGLETTLPLLYTFLVKTRQVDFYSIIEALTLKPAQILGLEFYPIQEGNDLNFVIFNMREKSVLNAGFFYSKSRNFPLLGETLEGKIEAVFYRDKVNRF